MNKKTFGSWLRREREAKGLNRSELARITVRGGKSAVSEPQISRIEAGARGLDLKTFEALAFALDRPLEELLEVAGYLPPALGEDAWTRAIKRIGQQVPPSVRADILEHAKLMRRLAERRGRDEKTGRRSEAAESS